MKYFHIIGTMCSGKSKLASEIQRYSDAAWWDIYEDFYIPLKIIKDNQFDFNTFNKHKYSISTILEIEIYKSIHEWNENIFIFESSGTSIFLNNALKKLDIEIIPIVLETPSTEILINRAKESGKDIDTVLKFTEAYIKKEQKIIDFINQNEFCKSLGVKAPLEPEEAYRIIERIINDY